jgi:phosphoribosylformimino-5-aminoimidazole carboxamide ribotide isomerase
VAVTEPEALPAPEAFLLAFFNIPSHSLAIRHRALYSGACGPLVQNPFVAALLPSMEGSRVQIFPAIDLRGGQCVRLVQGDYARETVFGADPAAVARRWVEQGATFLHLVDLDGAKQGRPINRDSVRAIIHAAGVPCQLGGGLRTEEHVREALDWGVTRVILGTRALRDPDWCAALCRRFPGRIVLGIDAREGRVSTEGWLQDSDILAIDLARQCATWGVSAIVYTDISRDGMLQGANVEATAELARAVPDVPVIASGGVTGLDDIARLARAGLAGCIVGRALYEGRLELPAALELARKETESLPRVSLSQPAG